MAVRHAAPWIDRLAEALPSAPWRTRFAPAPTGYLHLGHLVNAMHVWGIARAHRGAVLLRIEDHDRTRCRPEYEAALLDDLDWLGLVPDVYGTASFREDYTTHPARQSNQNARYAEALAPLANAGLIYACRCTRRDIERLVPHAPGEEPRYPGTCRTAQVPLTESFARRVHLAPSAQRFTDLRLGAITQTPAEQCGDMLVKDRHDQWTYQCAVTVDDAVHAIDVVIRGEDLLASTGRQRQLAAMLGRTQPLHVLHHALLVHPDGSKLSKATHDTALRDLRAAGAMPAELFGLAAQRAALVPDARPLPVEALPELFA
jgi:glutamyl-tRNA synthetase/glutamyl-Q tRNA(Asp) synthetase